LFAPTPTYVLVNDFAREGNTGLPTSGVHDPKDSEMADQAPVSTATGASLLALTARIVAAQVSHHSVTADALPGLIRDVYRSLATLGGADALAERPRPAVPIKQSITPDYLICLEDGKHLKMLKRHLRAAYDLSPAQYRKRWDLPADYPMVAPSYARRRSELAKELGLGARKRLPR
jgi:predicted transcriptional regulator